MYDIGISIQSIYPIFFLPTFLAKCVNQESINNKCLNLICQFDNCISARPDASQSRLWVFVSGSSNCGLPSRSRWSFENWSWIVNMGSNREYASVVSCLNFMVMNIWIVSEYCPPTEWGRGEYDGSKIAIWGAPRDLISAHQSGLMRRGPFRYTRSEVSFSVFFAWFKIVQMGFKRWQNISDSLLQ